MDLGGSCDPARLARLARLKLDSDEFLLFRDQLGRLLDAFNRINNLDTVGVPPFTHADDPGRGRRDDDAAGAAAPERRVAVPPLFGDRKGGGR
jgi:aspartyl/glutamyl-tRNA(Asn/Gln) amidotransferase C subunit